MARRVQKTWTIAPSKGIGVPAGRIHNSEPAFNALASSTAARAEGEMKENAGWNDQTGYARGALFGASEGTTIVLGTVNREYGPPLELGTSRMAPRAIILPTAMEVAPQYFDDAGKVLVGLMGGG